MQYVKAKTMAEYVNDISIIEISDYIKCLFASLYFENEKISDNTSKIFLNKIQTLKQNLLNFNELNEAFKILENFNWSKIPKTPCHGDLTLENILITQDKKLYLIDFLDSFYNSWMIDIAKLLQDLDLKTIATDLREELDSKLDSNTALPLIEEAVKNKAKGLYFDAAKELAKKSY